MIYAMAVCEADKLRVNMKMKTHKLSRVRLNES